MVHAVRADVTDEKVHRSVPRCSVDVVGPDRLAGGPGIGKAELPGVQDAVRIEGLLGGDEDVERGPERIAHEARPVEPDAVVVAEGTAVREHGAG